MPLLDFPPDATEHLVAGLPGALSVDPGPPSGIRPCEVTATVFWNFRQAGVGVQVRHAGEEEYIRGVVNDVATSLQRQLDRAVTMSPHKVFVLYEVVFRFDSFLDDEQTCHYQSPNLRMLPSLLSLSDLHVLQLVARRQTGYLQDLLASRSINARHKDT